MSREKLLRRLGADTFFVSAFSPQLFERAHSMRECILSPKRQDIPSPLWSHVLRRNDAIRVAETNKQNVYPRNIGNAWSYLRLVA
jgi:hypothetical protein